MYDEHYNNTDFNYDDLERQYQDKERASQTTPADLKAQLDEARQ